MNIILAALCLSAVVQQAPGLTTVYRCPGPPPGHGMSVIEQTTPTELPKAIAPPTAAVETPKPPAKAYVRANHHRPIKVKAAPARKPSCKPPKRSWYHRRGTRTWYTCG